MSTYATGSTTPWMVGLPTSQIVYKGLTVSAPNKVAETQYYYGNSTNCNSAATSQTPGLGDKLQRIRRMVLSNGTSVGDFIGHDAVGNMLCQKNPNTNQTSYAYDSNLFFLLTTTNALSQVTTQQYYGVNGVAADFGWIGQPKSTIDPNNATSTRRYDALGRVSQEYSPLSASTAAVAYTYPTLGQFGIVGTQKVTRTVTGDYSTATANQVYEGYFDGFGRILKDVQIPNSLSGATANIVRDTQFDIRGQVAQESLPYYAGGTVYWTSYKRDGLGRPYQTNYADGTRSLQCQDGRATVMVAPFNPSISGDSGQRKRYTRDGADRLIKVEEYNALVNSCAVSVGTPYATTTYEYDATDHLTKVTDAASNITTLTYNSLGRKTAMSDPDMGNWIYTYDFGGNLVQQTDAKNQNIYFQYDALERVRQKDYTSQKPLGSGDIVYNYDNYTALAGYDPGNLRPAAPGSHYPIGRLTSVKDSAGVSAQYYNLIGDTLQSDQRVDGTWYSMKQTYDALSRVKSLTYPDSAVVSYTYDSYGNLWTAGSYGTFTNYNAAGQMGRLTYGNGLITDRTYTAQNLRLATLKTGTTGTPTLLQNLSYTYYSAGNLDDITGTVRNASTGTNISANQGFVYDALDRLTSATGPYGTQTFTYSAIGNITNNSVLGAYTYGSKPHAVTQTGATTYTYDNNGNMSGGNGRTFIYDLDNRPTSIALSGVTTTMVYDASGSRAKKTVGSTTSVYIGDKYSCTVGGSCSRYIFGGSQRLAAVSGSSTYYYHGDHLGSTNVVTSRTQSPAQTVTYRPFGFTDVNVGSIDVRYKYTDQEIDDSTGFYYYKARYYAPLLARFIQPDSIVQDYNNPQSLNRYSYVKNNPISYKDPSGNAWWWFGDPGFYLDIGFISYDLYSLYKNPGWDTAGALALDVAGAILPGVTGLGQARYLTDIANRADSISIPEGTSKMMEGQLKHTEAQNILESSSNPWEFYTEQSYKGGLPSNRGEIGSVRPDVVEGDRIDPSRVYDFKFGQQGITDAWSDRVRSNIGSDPSIPIFEIRPGDLPARTNGIGAGYNIFENFYGSSWDGGTGSIDCTFCSYTGSGGFSYNWDDYF